MKQALTQEQWDEISKEEQVEVWLRINICGMPFYATPTIGELIEFLGDDWERLASTRSSDGGYICLKNDELCDALWEAVKYKLNEQSKEKSKASQTS